MRDSLRRVAFVLYHGIFFTLHTYATPHVDRRGQTIIGYEMISPVGETIFAGEDFAGSQIHADDSDGTLRALLSFLTLRPGDTDRDYFANYTAVQWAFVREHAEWMSEWAVDVCCPFLDLAHD
jgi:hypothetical protein